MMRSVQFLLKPSDGGVRVRYSITSLPSHTRKYWVSIFWQESTDYDELLTVCQGYKDYWISPLHQPDNECSKPHYHVVVGEERPFCPYKKRSKYSGIVNVAGATWSKELDRGIAYPVDNLPRLLAYLVHLNNPEKEQFEGGLRNVVTNNRGKLDEIVIADDGFNCYEWDEQHEPSSFMGSLAMIASEGFLTVSQTVKLVSWYANHMDVFEGREIDYSASGGNNPWEVVEV